MKGTYMIIRFFTTTLPASFTIEASVILPIAFVIIARFISVSFTIHDKVIDFSKTIYEIIRTAPQDSDSDSASDGSEGSALINIENLNGRKVLLKYKLLKDGYHSLTGGLDDED